MNTINTSNVSEFPLSAAAQNASVQKKNMSAVQTENDEPSTHYPPLNPSACLGETESKRSTRSMRSVSLQPLTHSNFPVGLLGTRKGKPTRSTRSKGETNPPMDVHNPQGYEGGIESADPFIPLSDNDRVNAAIIPASTIDDQGSDDLLDLQPCLEMNPPLYRFRFSNLGEPSQVWFYRDADGHPLMAVARHDAISLAGVTSKNIRPWSYGRRLWTNREGRQCDVVGWHCKTPSALRPLYGLDRLAARPNAEVLICEGEKSADAASLLFLDFVCITSQGGAKASGKSNWTPLNARNVTIWPDQDEAGISYADKVAALAGDAGANVVRLVDVPNDWPEGWDLADALPEGIAVDRLAEMLVDAQEGGVTEMPEGFTMSGKGLFFENSEGPPILIADPFRVIGQTRNDVGEDWGVLLRWRDRDGRAHQWAIPRGMIHDHGNPIGRQLENSGLSCTPDGKAPGLFKRFIGKVTVARRLCCVTRTGWHHTDAGPVFVMPGGTTYGRGAANTILQVERATEDATFRPTGTLSGWKQSVAALTVGNDLLILFLAAAFAGPLLDVVSEPSGGLHLMGNSRSGKSTAALVAASVWGSPTPNGQMRHWRSTANGLEATAAQTADALLILDEMGQADAHEVGDVVYMLANEAGKQRSQQTGISRRRQTWRILFLSTGEVTLAQKMGEVGKRPMAGLEVRLVNLKADGGAGMGVFQQLHGRAGGAAFADEIKENALLNHGTASRAFLQKLAQDRAYKGAELRETLRCLRQRFIDEHVPLGAAGQVRSVAARFALIAAAGELACEYGILPWQKGDAMRAVGLCFVAWLAERGGTAPGEDAAAVSQVRAFIETHGESRFTPLVSHGQGQESLAPEPTRTMHRAGFRRRVEGPDGCAWEYLIFPETWKAEVCKGLDAKRTANLLVTQGWLLGATPRDRSTVVTIPGEGKRRVYRLSGAILGDDTLDVGSNVTS